MTAHVVVALVATATALTGCQAPPTTDQVGASGVGAPSGSPLDPAPVPSSANGPYPVARVVDGDTIWVIRDGQRVKVRLLGIDAPEISPGGRECFGDEALARVRELLAGASVFTAGDPSQARVDRYGRELSYVWLKAGGRNGLLVNQVMLEQGFAREYTYDRAYAYQRSFRQAERRARAAKAGMWAAAGCAR